MANFDLVAYERRLCWWCGSRLAVTGQKTILDILGNKIIVHTACEEDARHYNKPLTAHPRDGPVWDPDWTM